MKQEMDDTEFFIWALLAIFIAGMSLMLALLFKMEIEEFAIAHPAITGWSTIAASGYGCYICSKKLDL